MYVGLTLVYLGVAGTRAEIWPVIVLPVLLAYVNFVVIPVEERHLRERLWRCIRAIRRESRALVVTLLAGSSWHFSRSLPVKRATEARFSSS